jgi:hypothetical protein
MTVDGRVENPTDTVVSRDVAPGARLAEFPVLLDVEVDRAVDDTRIAAQVWWRRLAVDLLIGCRSLVEERPYRNRLAMKPFRGVPSMRDIGRVVAWPSAGGSPFMSNPP